MTAQGSSSAPGRVAVVDGFSAGRYLVQELVNRGIRCIHVRSRPRLDDYYERTFQPELYEYDLGHDPDIARVAAQLDRLGVRRVVAGTEPGVLTADRLAAATATPGNDQATAAARRDKFQMAQTLRAAGLDAPHGALVSSVAEALDWHAASGLAGVVVKPVDSAASDSVYFCATAAEVRTAVTAVLSATNLFGDANRRAVVQEALIGPELYVNTVSLDGRHFVVETWRYVKRRTANGMPVFDFEEPVDLSAPITAAAHDYVNRALTALGVRNAAGHSELVLTDRGPVLIDPGARLGGGVLPAVPEKIIGYSHAGLFADSIADPAGFSRLAGRLPRDWPQPIRYVSLINQRAGIASVLDWVELLEGLPSFMALANSVTPGTWLPETSTLVTSPGFVYLSAESQDIVEADYDRIRRWEAAGLYTGAVPAILTATG
jgi:biotin carboxylase